MSSLFGDLNPTIIATEETEVPTGAPSMDAIRESIKRGGLNTTIKNGPYLGVILSIYQADERDLGRNEWTFKEGWIWDDFYYPLFLEIRIPELDSWLPFPKMLLQTGAHHVYNNHPFCNFSRMCHPVHVPQKAGSRSNNDRAYRVGDIIWCDRTSNSDNIYYDLPKFGKLAPFKGAHVIRNADYTQYYNRFKRVGFRRGLFVGHKRMLIKPKPPTPTNPLPPTPKVPKPAPPPPPPPPPVPTKTELDLWNDYTSLGHLVPKHMKTMIKTEDITYANGTTSKITLHKEHMAVYKNFLRDLEAEVQKLIDAGARGVKHTTHLYGEAFRVYKSGGGTNKSSRKGSVHNSGFALDFKVPASLNKRRNRTNRKHWVNLVVSLGLKHGYTRFGIGAGIIHMDMGKTYNMSTGAPKKTLQRWWVYDGFKPMTGVSFKKTSTESKSRLSAEWFTGVSIGGVSNPAKRTVPAFLQFWQPNSVTWDK